MRSRRLTVISLLAMTACLVPLSACGGNSQAEPAKTRPAPTSYVGRYKGRGAGEEVRFRKPGILTLTVKHNVEFSFKIDEKGNVIGDGEITYTLDRNTEGLDSLVASVRGAMQMVPNVGGVLAAADKQAKTANEISKAMDTGEKVLGKNSPGKLSYDAPHLKYGPELRFFKLKGKVDKFDLMDSKGTEYRMTLEVDGDFKGKDGKASSDLTAQWEVNGKKEESKFPCWSPFLDGYVLLKKGEDGLWTADFSAKGEHRENKGKPVKVWEEYGYYWLVQQRDW